MALELKKSVGGNIESIWFVVEYKEAGPSFYNSITDIKLYIDDKLVDGIQYSSGRSDSNINDGYLREIITVTPNIPLKSTDKQRKLRLIINYNDDSGSIASKSIISECCLI